MEATTSNFKSLFPEFNSVDDAKVSFMLELAREQFNCSENAVLYLAAHMLSLDSNEDVSGAGNDETQGSGFAVRQKVGDLEVQYVAPKDADDAYYMQTPYGRRFLALRNARKKIFPVRIGG